MVSASSVVAGALAVAGGVALYQVRQLGDLLSGFSEAEMIKMSTLQLAVTGFCLDSGTLDKLDAVSGTETGHNFTESGDINNEDYTKQSIYALLYSMYMGVGPVQWRGLTYQFTFNTWGLGGAIPTAYPDSEPQRHGKAAYAGLVNFPAVKEYLTKVTREPKIVEIGCGTGAGANLITQLLPGATYTALDMQKAAVQTCERIHMVGNPRLKCVHGNGRRVPVPDGSQDIVVISETHIADVSLDEESKAILDEVHRVLKPGGLFVWGNALPTRVWVDVIKYLPRHGFKERHVMNVTKEAVDARVEDEDRVNAYCTSLFDNFFVLRVHSRCRHTVDRLLKNFYRHPGTALFDRMVTGYDSYLQMCHQKVAK